MVVVLRRVLGVEVDHILRVLDVSVAALVVGERVEHVEADAVRRLDALADHLRNVAVASVDADLGGCVETEKSTTGLVIMLNGGPISWKSKKQSTVSTATLEAEMKAAALVGMEIVWLRDLVTEFGVLQGCIRVMEDNSGCVALAHGQKDTSK